jgi:hypothetical protein
MTWQDTAITAHAGCTWFFDREKRSIFIRLNLLRHIANAINRNGLILEYRTAHAMEHWSINHLYRRLRAIGSNSALQRQITRTNLQLMLISQISTFSICTKSRFPPIEVCLAIIKLRPCDYVGHLQLRGMNDDDHKSSIISHSRFSLNVLPLAA